MSHVELKKQNRRKVFFFFEETYQPTITPLHRPLLKFNSEEPVFMRCQGGIKGVYEWQNHPARPTSIPSHPSAAPGLVASFRYSALRLLWLGGMITLLASQRPSSSMLGLLCSCPAWRELEEEAVPGQLHSLAAGWLAGWPEWAHQPLHRCMHQLGETCNSI